METGDIELHLLLLTCNRCFIFASYNYDFIIMRYLASVYTVFKMNILFVVKFLQKTKTKTKIAPDLICYGK